MKALKIIKNILVWIVVIAAVGMMIFTIVSVKTFDKTDVSVFGYKAFIVMSDSMSKTDFDAGDLVLVKETDPQTLKEGDIIAYLSQDPSNFGETVTHKIRKLTTDEEGNPGFVTYGTTTDKDDETIVTYEWVLGKYKNSIPNVGKFFFFLKTTPGYICCILIPFMLIILFQLINCIKLFRQYKREQMAELMVGREELDKEKENTRVLKEELERLKASLAEQENTRLVQEELERLKTQLDEKESPERQNKALT